METKMRKIMVEVTPQEYQKILTGGLGNLDGISTKDLVNELIKRGNLYDSHYDSLSNLITRYYTFDKYSNGEIKLIISEKPKEVEPEFNIKFL